VQHRYNALGQRQSTTNELGHTSDFAYDKSGRLVSTTSAAVGVHHVNAGDNGWPLISDGAQRLTETISWDRAGRKLRTTNAAGEAVKYQYDLRGNVIETVQMGVTTRMAYDAQGRKVAERDGNGRTATWAYDYFGQLRGHQDIGGADYDYRYDHARQLTAESNDRPNLAKNIAYHYDAAGQLTHIQDITHGKWSLYSYDLAGHRVREQTLQGGITYQDNHLAYDELGRLQWVADGRAHLQIDYDKVGNRTRIQTHVINGEAAQDSQRHFRYDAMNRQIVADAVNAAGQLGTQGHRIAYDKAGNKVSDTWHGNVVRRIEGSNWSGEDWEGNRFSYTSAARYEAQLGMTSEVYGHDALGRITRITRDGTVVDERAYDRAGRIVQTGAVGLNPDYVKKLHGTNSQDTALQGNGTEVKSSIYDASGRLYGQRVHDSQGNLKYQLWYAKQGDASQLDVDGAGNMLGYLLDNKQAGQLFHYRYEYEAQEGYREATITGEDVGTGIKGITTQTHDANGFLIEVGDSQQAAKNRYFVNDAAGKVLYANQGGHVQRQLIVNGEVLGRYGEAVDPDEPANAQGVPVFTTVADFSFGFDANTAGNTPMLADTTHTVGAGDTLQSIAQLRYGDSRLWYRIAEANGVTGNEQLTAGQALKVPGTEVTGNASGTFKPYNAGEIVGDTSPYIPQPTPKKPSFLAQLIVVIVMIVVTILTAGAAAAALGSSFAALSAATAVTVGGVALSATGAALAVGIGAAVGSIVSQAVAVATGVQEKFSWKQVGMSAIGGAVSGGMGNWAPLGGESTGFGNTVIRAAVGNVASQGIGVATGLQNRFSWKSVAASAVGAGVGQAVGSELGLNDPNFATKYSFGEQFGRRLVTGLAAGAATAVARGGKVAVTQVAVDAFGNALGYSLAEAGTSDPTRVMGGSPAPIDDNQRRAMEMGMGPLNPGMAARAVSYSQQELRSNFVESVGSDDLIPFEPEDRADAFRRSEREYRAAERSNVWSQYRANASRSPMSLLNPDQSTVGGYLGSVASGAWHATKEVALLASDAAQWLGRAAAGQPQWEISYSSELGRLLADEKLSLSEKTTSIAKGTLLAVANTLKGEPEAIGGLLAGWGTGRLMASPGTRTAAIVDELAATSSRNAEALVAALGRDGAVDMSYAMLRNTKNASAEIQVAAEANAVALADRLGSWTKGDILEIQAYRQAVRNNDVVLLDGPRLEMLKDATPGASRQAGLDLPRLTSQPGGGYRLVIGEIKNYTSEAGAFSAVTRNFNKNLSALERQVDSNVFGLSDRIQQGVLRDIQSRNFTVEIYGNRTTTMNRLSILSDQIRASVSNGSSILTTFRKVPW